MNTFLIIVAIVIFFILLYNKIQTVIFRIEDLKREMTKLKDSLQHVEQSTITTTEKTPILTTVQKETFSTEEEVLTEMFSLEPITDCTPSIEKISVSSEESPSPLSTPQQTLEKSHKRHINYEKLIGENLFGKIGILILVAGIGLFVKYAIDNEWINETMRTILGFLVGSGLVFIAERLHRKYRTFSSLLAGGAFAIFYVTTVIAYHYYGLFSQTAAFLILIVVTLLMSILSVIYDRRELATIALTGGFLAPFLISSGEGNYITLFSYILILNCGMFALSVYKKWSELPLISFLLTYLCVLLYTLNSFSTTVSANILFWFTTSFYLLFLLPLVIILKDSHNRLNQILLGVVTLNNFIYLGFGLYFLNALHLPIKLNGLLTLGIALINAGIASWLRKQLKEQKLLIHIFLTIVVTFVSITIPLQLEGNYITLFWASEMVLLLYLNIRSGFKLYEYFSYAIVLLTYVSWFMDLPNTSLLFPEKTDSIIFLNGYFFTNLYVGICLIAYAFLLKKYKQNIPLNTIAITVACILLWYAPILEFQTHIIDENLSMVIKSFFTGCYLLLLSFLLRKRFPFAIYPTGYLIGAGINAAIFMLIVPIGSSYWVLPPYSIASWFYWGIIITHIIFTSRSFYAHISYRLKEAHLPTIALNIISMILLLIAVWLFVKQLHHEQEFSTGFSICLALVGFIQMYIGMRLHFRLLRFISLFTFGIILLKLLFIDLWQLSTIGKIIVFIILGIILLILSFMYQKLKNVLFKEDQNNE